MNHRPSTILPSVSLLAVLMLASLSRAQGLMLDKCLDDLAEKGSLGPVVAVMHAPVEGTADLSSLEGLAKTFGLTLFEQDGIHVLGLAECIHLYDLSPYFPKERPKQAVSPQDRFFYSLTRDQVEALGTRSGIHFSDLSEEQQSIVRAIFTGTINLSVPMNAPQPADSSEELSPLTQSQYSLGNVPVEDLTITGELIYVYVTVGDGTDEYVCGLETQRDAHTDTGESNLEVYPKPEPAMPPPPSPIGPNVLKPSDLDYERPELQKPAQFELRTTLKDVVALAAEESGLPLYIGPGSDQVALYVRADTSSIGQVLRAVSLATGGTWRKVGDLLIYTLDLIGIGAFDQQIRDWYDFMRPAAQYTAPPLDPQRVGEIMSGLSPASATLFSLTPQQIMDLVTRLTGSQLDAEHIPWQALTPQQQSVVMQACADPDKAAFTPAYISPKLATQIVFHFPAVENEAIGRSPAKYIWTWLLGGWNPTFPLSEFQTRTWPKGSKIPMPSGTRGLLYRVSESNTPATVVTSAQRYGLNTLLIRVYTDGHTIFPSQQFPQLPGLKSDDFLRNVIAIAHARGIKVVGVIDVLRWSDGDKKHWLYKTPEIIDRDIAGRMNTEWMAQRIVDSDEAIDERMAYGDAFDGDFVSPFQPLVRQKLSALVGELATYDLDGLAFDHAAIVRPMPWEDEVRQVKPGQTGFDELARGAFVRTTGVDPIDIISVNFASVRVSSPMLPVVAGANSCLEPWNEFYRTGCYSLLEMLVDGCHKAKPGIPVWWLDTYSDSDDASLALTGVDKVVAWSHPQSYDESSAGIDLIRIVDSLDLLYMGSHIARLQGKTFAGMLGEDEMGPPPETPVNDIILDFACTDARRTEFLKLLETARPEKTR